MLVEIQLAIIPFVHFVWNLFLYLLGFRFDLDSGFWS